HPASPVLHRFIRSTPRIRHVLITFRHKARSASAWADLAAYEGAPGPEAFHDAVFLEDGYAGDVAPSRAPGRATDPRDRGRSAGSEPGVRGGAGAPLRPEHGARGVPLERWRRDM